MSSSISSSRSYVARLLALIATATVTGLSATEWLVRAQVEPRDARPIHQRLVETAPEVDAAFGDSHMATAFDPPAGMVNLAFPASAIEDIARDARAHFAERAPTPGRVIVQADAHMFASYRAAPTRGDEEGFDHPLREQPAFIVRALDPYHRRKLLAYWSVWLRRGEFRSHLAIHPNGWIARTGEWGAVNPDIRRTRAMQRAMAHVPATGFAESHSAATYQDLLEYLSRRGARACLAELPVTLEYRQQLEGEAYRAARAWFAAHARRLGMRYVSLAGLYDQRPDLFVDADHLGPEGARDLSPRLVRDCFE